ncbi:MAG: FAD-dependent oxidoreductase, partial [Hyphomicrobiales bacterium]|nr:FAD-dependent oxidoreductase [Hyphomicrobiales bacterium]
EAAVRLTAYLDALGIDVVPDARVAWSRRGVRLAAVGLADGSPIEGDLFVACAGVTPRIALARQCGLATRRGIVVDAGMRTNDPAIYALGDAAEPPTPTAGLWPEAVAQAQIVVADMSGDAAPPARAAPMLRLKSEGIDAFSFGEIEASGDTEVASSAPGLAAHWRLVSRGGRLSGGCFAGPPGAGRVFAGLAAHPRTLAEAVATLTAACDASEFATPTLGNSHR